MVHVKEPTKYNSIFTIGHSNADLEDIITLLKKYHIQVLVDIRSTPYSKYVPQANREIIDCRAEKEGIKYVFMGELLGGKSKGTAIKHDELDNPDYSGLANTDHFQEGLHRLLEGAHKYTVCIMCSEEDPSRCHRGLLVSRELVKMGVEIRHIRHNGVIESQDALEQKIAPIQRTLFAM